MILISSINSDFVSSKTNFDKNNAIFLGPWCFKRIDEIETFGNGYKNPLIAKPFGVSLNERKMIHNLYTKYYSKCFNNLVSVLNEYHKTDYDMRFWNIFLGTWFNRFFSLILNRYFHLTKTINENKNINMHWGIEPDLTKIIAKDEKSSVILGNEKNWNAMVYSILIEKFFLIKQKYLKVKFIENYKKNRNYIKEKISNRTFLSNDSNIFIYKPYVKISDQIKIQLMLGQFPVFWSENRISENHFIDDVGRNSLQNQLNIGDNIERVLGYLMPILLPKIFLEQFKETLAEFDNASWPTLPKVIYTANGFSGDSVFQLWTAYHSSLGTRYIVGQHGNNYGTSKFSQYWPELNTPDIFLSWGWKDTKNIYSSQIHPIGNLIYRRMTPKVDYSNLQKIIVLTKGRGNRSSLSCRDFEFISEIEDSLYIIKKLIKETSTFITIRLHGNINKEDRYYIHEKIKALGKRVSIEAPEKNIVNSIKKYDLVVFTYDSTGFLEMIQNQVPVMALIKNYNSNILDDVKFNYKLLEYSHIIFEKRDQLCKTIITYHADKVLWQKWLIKLKKSPEINNFKERFVKKCEYKNFNLAKFLIREAKSVTRVL